MQNPCLLSENNTKYLFFQFNVFYIYWTKEKTSALNSNTCNILRPVYMGGSKMISEGGRFDKITVLTLRIQTANRVNPDQTPQNAASDRGLLCLALTQQI